MRKALRLVPSVNHRPQLQRSRTRVSAEGAVAGGGVEFPDLLQRSRTRVSAEGGEDPDTSHPLIDLLQRSRTRVSAEGDRRKRDAFGHRFASTEPHSCECGRRGTDSLTKWRRDASTEPHSCECGRRCRSHSGRFTRRASTEPHSCECGRVDGFALSPLIEMLQRSRTRVSAEGSLHRAKLRSHSSLQRSRTRVSAEG